MPFDYRPLSNAITQLERHLSDGTLQIVRVDVMDWADTSETFRKIIERDKVVVQHGLAGSG